MYSNLWEQIRKDMPRKGRGKGAELDPDKLPARLLTALDALHGHYEKTSQHWHKAGTQAPPCCINVCQNTAIFKLAYDFISGFHRGNENGTSQLQNGRLPLFRDFDESTGNAPPRLHTLLIHSRAVAALLVELRKKVEEIVLLVYVPPPVPAPKRRPDARLNRADSHSKRSRECGQARLVRTRTEADRLPTGFVVRDPTDSRRFGSKLAIFMRTCLKPMRSTCGGHCAG